MCECSIKVSASVCHTEDVVSITIIRSVLTKESRLESCLETDHTSRFARLVYRISGQSKSFEKLKNEVDKCILVCANCHREIHDGITECPKL